MASCQRMNVISGITSTAGMSNIELILPWSFSHSRSRPLGDNHHSKLRAYPESGKGYVFISRLSMSRHIQT